MDFGMIPYAQLSSDSLTLRSKESYACLPGKPDAQAALYIGLTKWNEKLWSKGDGKPALKSNELLPAYSSMLNSVELNATHYQIYPGATIDKWNAQVKDRDFRFVAKFPKVISHAGKISPESKQAETDAFLESVSHFGELLGGCFIQFSEYVQVSQSNNILGYLASLPTDLPVFTELRHTSWFSNKTALEQFVTTSAAFNKGLVITDSPGRRDVVHMELAIPQVMVRFVCMGLNDIDRKRIENWATVLQQWYAKGLTKAYFFLHIHDESQLLPVTDYVKYVFKGIGVQMR